MTDRKQTIVTFKADAWVVDALSDIPNRSAFIRTAVLAALENLCPLCAGTGILTPDQKRHWERFAEHHELTECAECHERHLVCTHNTGDEVHDSQHEGN